MSILPPWTKNVTPHDDIRYGRLDNAQFGAKLGEVVRQDPHCSPIYRNARQFFTATYLTSELKKLLTTVLNGLTGQNGNDYSGSDRVLQLRTPFGGGKTHALISLYHLTKHRDQLHSIPELAALPNPGTVRLAAFTGQDIEVTTGQNLDGQQCFTPWGILAWQLGGAATYELVRQNDQQRIAPGGDTLRAMIGDRPTLLLLDELLLYIDAALGVAVGESNLGRQVLGFMQRLTEVVSNLPHAVMVYSLQASTREALNNEGLLDTLDKLVSRVDAKKEPVSGDEVMKVVQRRLFSDVGDPAVIAEVARQQAELFRKFHYAYTDTERDRQNIDQQAEILAQRIAASYPLHPDLLDLMYLRWGSLPSYQRTRGALQFLARAIATLWERQVHGSLIGPGDIPLDDPDVKQVFFSQVGERDNNYSAVLRADLLGPTAKVAPIDQRFANEPPPLNTMAVGSRLATAILLYSFGAKQGEDRGVTEREVAAACLAPNLDRTVLIATLSDLREALLYLHHVSHHYRFETQPNLNKLIADQAERVESQEGLRLIKEQLEATIQKTRDYGRVAVWPKDAAEIKDRIPEFTTVYLDPTWADQWTETDLTLVKEKALAWLDAHKREYKNALAFVLPKREPMAKLRQLARTFLAIEILKKDQNRYKLSAEGLKELSKRAADAKANLDSQLRHLYGLVLLPIPNPESTPPISLEAVDLPTIDTSNPWQQRIADRLKNHIFSTITLHRLLPMYGLDQGDATHILANTVIQGFFIYPNAPKLWSAAPIKSAILGAIATGQLGYTPNLTLAPDGTATLEDLQYLHFQETIPSDEFDPDGYLLTPALVESLRQQFPTPETPTPETLTPEPPSPNPQPSSPTAADPPKTFQTEKTTASTIERSVLMEIVKGNQPAKHYTLNSVIQDAAQFFELVNAIQALSDKSNQMTIKIELHAHTQTEFEPTWIRNAIEEVLDEANISATTRLE